MHLRQYILHPVYILYNPGGLRVWGWDRRHAGGAPVRVLSVVSRPGGAAGRGKEPGAAPKPPLTHIFRSRLIGKQGPLAIHRAMRSSYLSIFLIVMQEVVSKLPAAEFDVQTLDFLGGLLNTPGMFFE